VTASQKDENRLVLYLAVILNAVVLYALVTTQKVEPEAWVRALADVQLAIPAVLGLGFVTLLNSQLSHKTKERIVFLEWEHPLPGSRAFTWFLPRDHRINAVALEARFGPFPSDPADQNRTWYRIYSTVRDEPAIATMRRTYLFARDYAALVVLMLIFFGGVALIQLQSPLIFILYTLALLAQLALAINAARKTAERWVTTAMAMAAL
jgi:hypothetical protein